MTDDIVFSKKQSVERCVKQIRAYYARPSDQPFEEDYFKQDAISANLQRVAELCIDLANHVVRVQRLGLPKESKESFDLLEKAKIIEPSIAKQLIGMVGFRNIMVHEYQELELAIMVDVVQNHLDDLLVFIEQIMAAE